MTAPAPLLCLDCGTALKPDARRKTGCCKSCAARANVKSDRHRKSAREAMERRWADESERLRLASLIRAGIKQRLANDPAYAAQRRAQCVANGRKTASLINTPAGSDIRRRAARSWSERWLGWCPFEYRDDYRQLRINQGFRAAEARRLIEDQIKLDAARYAATGQLQQSVEKSR